jgi:hypothetical protein
VVDAQDRHARGDERHLLFAAHWLPLALSAARQLSAPLDRLPDATGALGQAFRKLSGTDQPARPTCSSKRRADKRSAFRRHPFPVGALRSAADGSGVFVSPGGGRRGNAEPVDRYGALKATASNPRHRPRSPEPLASGFTAAIVVPCRVAARVAITVPKNAVDACYRITMIGLILVLGLALGLAAFIGGMVGSERAQRRFALRRGTRSTLFPAVSLLHPWQGTLIPCRRSREFPLNTLIFIVVFRSIGHFLRTNEKTSLRFPDWQGMSRGGGVAEGVPLGRGRPARARQIFDPAAAGIRSNIRRCAPPGCRLRRHGLRRASAACRRRDWRDR